MMGAGLAPRAAAQVFSGISRRISSVSGKRPVSSFEKMFVPSSSSSKTPPELRISSASMPRARLMSAARLAARKRYPH